MTKDGNISKYIYYGAIAGFFGGFAHVIMSWITATIVPGSFDLFDYNSQVFLGRAPGDPDLLLSLIIHQVFAPLNGILFGIIAFLLITRITMDLDFTRYVIMGVVIGIVFSIMELIFIPQVIPLDLLSEGPLILINNLVYGIGIALVFFFLVRPTGDSKSFQAEGDT